MLAGKRGYCDKISQLEKALTGQKGYNKKGTNFHPGG
jgi:hypothetical protein